MRSSPSIAAAATLMLFSSASVLFAAERQKYPQDETLTVQSLTLSDSQFLTGETSTGIPVALSGELRLPSWDEHLPAVVLLHGSGGPEGGPARHWRDFLNEMGIATFRLDSFTGRGISNVVLDQSQLGWFAQMYDMYRAVDVLAAHPKVDPARIVVMGFSRGGTSVLYGSLQRFQRLYGPKQTTIAAHIPFYPRCNLELIDDIDVADVPIREFHGSADNGNPAAPCRSYFARLSAAGRDALMTEYAGAHHTFDNVGQTERNESRNQQTTVNCRLREANGKVINIDTGAPFAYQDSCVIRGYTQQYSELATKAARASVKAFLTDLFHLQ